jgi:SagB-type dehydrogenase family enzyme
VISAPLGTVPEPEARLVADYHARTKHGLQAYARGPETLDWDAQPNPFREFAGAPRTALAFAADGLDADFAESCEPGEIAAVALNAESVGALLELSVGLSAWKEFGPDRWALRCNPSSGNLHPTETYVISQGVLGLADGLHHYVSRDHALELRRRDLLPPGAPSRLWIGLSSVHWREAWKYGERAFRYSQIDIGHALGAFRYAGGALGWSVKFVSTVSTAELAASLGLDRAEDFSGVEREDAELLIAIEATPDFALSAQTSDGEWMGQANRLDARPIYSWPVIEEVSHASEGRASGEGAAGENLPLRSPTPPVRAAEVILGRRSAQRYDAKFTMGLPTFLSLLDSLLPRVSAPWDVWPFQPRLHSILFVHRVEGIEPGLYALPRHPSAVEALRAHMRDDFEWREPELLPAHVPLKRLLKTDCRGVARNLNCRQAIASDACFALTFIAEFEPLITANPWRYRQLHWEAGLIGQALYLEAEAAGLRGTGIGCFFDNEIHATLGLRTDRFQALYGFTVGRPLVDERITTLPAYDERRKER